MKTVGQLAWAIGVGCAALAFAPRAQAEELTGPPLETAGKPVSPPAPVEGITPKLAGLNMLGGVALVDLGPLNDRLSTSGYPNKLPLAFPLLGGQGFGLFSRFTIGGSGAGFLSRSVDHPDSKAWPFPSILKMPYAAPRQSPDAPGIFCVRTTPSRATSNTRGRSIWSHRPTTPPRN